LATKSITVDLEAYNRLAKAKRGNESFSETIKRVVKAPPNLDAIMREMGKHPLSDDTVAAVEEIVASRRSRSRRKR
jgi:predicted CopG family antitoxin